MEVIVQNQMTIAGIVIDFPVLYSEGYMLDAEESKGIEQHRCDKIRNNLTPKVKKWQAAGMSEDEIRSQANDYIESFKIGIRSRNGRDPVMNWAIHLAKQVVLQRGKKLKGTTILKQARKMAPKFVQLAQRQIKELNGLASRDLDDNA